MTYLFFLDDSGHDHNDLPYEVRGGVVVPEARLGALTQQMQALEMHAFGVRLRHHRSAIGGSTLLHKDPIRWATQTSPANPGGGAMGDYDRQFYASGFLWETRHGRPPSLIGFTAYGQACVLAARRCLELLREHDARVFATAVPRRAARQRSGYEPHELRADLVALLQRFYRFLDEQRQPGLIVLAQREESAPWRLGRRIERFLRLTPTGQAWAQRIVPAVFATSGDESYPLRAADVCTYCINLGVRLPNTGMTAPVRPEIAQTYAPLVMALQWTAKQAPAMSSIAFVPTL